MIQNSYPTPQRKPISIWCLIVVLRSIKRLCTSIKQWIGKRVIKNQSVKGTQFSCFHNYFYRQARKGQETPFHSPGAKAVWIVSS